ncbi:MFS transporter [Phenylobacterium sp. Root77]|uniref:CmlA/FloR family chloramphenicol efflux MFS transporter n=1 Tax=unclassified Phenylobacterium TaxID=2640670 RepID=UPI0006FD08D6|nr:MULTISPECIES: CmlA/FloR family chloramphenicol efflux MFS transporter [unclassified Phenylobacterium]KQW69143.1 MFS transporter [Phenylobacterium sp. Root1277]KQW95491.1 MFS transporter [Phenylobacterium sp. Root1290]KRC41281.1 MFS transporter [Phenylobacterium sp. Root77]
MPGSKAWNASLPAALLLLAPFDVLASLAMDIYLPVVPEMPERLGTTPAVVQLTLSLYMAVLGLGQIVFGPLSDRVGRRPVLLGGGLLFAAASLALAMTDTGPAFVALRILQAAGASAAMVATFATVRDVYAERPEGAVIYGLLGSILSFVPALGPVAGALIAQGLGWRAIFGGLALLMAAALVNAWRGWSETRPSGTPAPAAPLRRILSSYAFWTYTLGFSAAMGAFFVFFSTAPRVLIGQAGFSQLGFSLAFATAAVVMIVTSRFAKWFVGRWGVAGCLARGMAALLCGAALLATGQLWGEPSFWSFVAPMWVMAVGIVLSVSVSANGALAAFGSTAGTAVALYFCVESLIVGAVGTLAVVWLDGRTAWPLVVYATVMALATLAMLGWGKRRGR